MSLPDQLPSDASGTGLALTQKELNKFQYDVIWKIVDYFSGTQAFTTESNPNDSMVHAEESTDLMGYRRRLTLLARCLEGDEGIRLGHILDVKLFIDYEEHTLLEQLIANYHERKAQATDDGLDDETDYIVWRRRVYEFKEGENPVVNERFQLEDGAWHVLYQPQDPYDDPDAPLTTFSGLNEEPLSEMEALLTEGFAPDDTREIKETFSLFGMALD